MERVQYFLSYPLVPGEIAAEGIKFDFCDGLRILFPNGTGEHRVVCTDEDTGTVLQDLTVCDGGKFRTDIRYYVKWHFDIYRNGSVIYSHTMDLEDKEVLFTMNTDAIGDTVAWFTYVDRFAKLHKCKAGIIVGKKMRPLLEDNYKHIQFFDRGAEKMLAPYASYLLGINYACEPKMQKQAFYNMPLSDLIGYDLGFDNSIKYIPPKLSHAGDCGITQKFVCMSVLGSCDYKCWNNSDAIDETVSWLKSKGYRVLLVDLENRGLHGSEDFTGDRPLKERVSLFRECSVFIGMSSGLSWLADASGAKVVMISGFTEPWHEFNTPYRVGNWNICHGCWNRPKGTFECKNGRYECSKVNSRMVIDKLKLALGEE